jgi:general stress protein CsbA
MERSTLNNDYTAFLILVSVVAATCLDSILISAIKKKHYFHFSWLIPLALGYTSSVIISILYDFNPKYWSSLARAGSYPLIVAGLFTGLLMIYGWIRFAVTFYNSDQPGPPLTSLKSDKYPLNAVGIKDSVWPPPPVEPK